MKETNIKVWVGVIALIFASSLVAQAQTWSYTGDLNTRRDYHTATLLNSGNVLVAGGMYKGSYGISSAEVYNSKKGTFTVTGALNNRRYEHTATLLTNGEVLIVGGQYSSGVSPVCLSSAELYNPSTGTFTLTGSLQTARCRGFTATLLDSGMVLVVGGSNRGGVVSGAELYNPSTATFSATGSPQVARSNLTATLLANGEVLIAGGCASTCYNSSELYNPSSGTFTSTGSMSAARSQFTGTRLTSGEVLVTGGATSNLEGLKTAELYNPSTGEWSPTGNMNYGHQGHTATLLQSGEVLIASPLPGVDLYNPASGTFSIAASLPYDLENAAEAAVLLNDGAVLLPGGFNPQGQEGLAWLNTALLFH